MNQEQFTLREIIQQRFEELDAHIAALDAVTIRSEVPSFLTTYADLRRRYEFEAFRENLEELQERVIVVEKYQTVMRFVIRQIVSVVVTVLTILLVGRLFLHG